MQKATHVRLFQAAAIIWAVLLVLSVGGAALAHGDRAGEAQDDHARSTP